MLFFAIKIKMPYSQRSENTARSYFYLSDMAKSILCSLCHPVKGLWAYSYEADCCKADCQSRSYRTGAGELRQGIGFCRSDEDCLDNQKIIIK